MQAANDDAYAASEDLATLRDGAVFLAWILYARLGHNPSRSWLIAMMSPVTDAALERVARLVSHLDGIGALGSRTKA